jgi:hypothetical protein
VALRTGLLKQCLLHGDVYDPGQHDYQGALMVAAFLINQSDPLVAPFGGDRMPLAGLLQSICETHYSGCPRCSLTTANVPASLESPASSPVHSPNLESQ